MSNNEIYNKVAWHIFCCPNREECLYEWDRLHRMSPYYAKGIELINDFFTRALKSELNRLMSNL